MDRKLSDIARNFQLEGEVYSIKTLGNAFINDTYYLSTLADHDSDYLLQRKNKSIFKDVPEMMRNIDRLCVHIKTKVVEEGGNPSREAMTIIKTKDEKLFYLDEDDDYWTMCLFIKDSFTYEAAKIPDLAYAGGLCIGKFQRQCADFDEVLTDILPGLHNIRYCFEQWDKVLAKDPLGRKANIQEEISWIEARREEMLKFWKLYEDSLLPSRVTHNDTRLSNILFDHKEGFLCMIDLDTVVRSLALNDFGDAIRTYTNTGKEDDENLNNVSMNIEMYSAFTLGYLKEARSFLNKIELKHLAFSAKYITFEQVLRFLMDYIAGDNHYRTNSAEHNLTRARAQYKLLCSMEDQFKQMKRIITSAIKK